MAEQWQLLISGKVQGVGFRAWTLRQAEAIGLDGYVRNLPDGRVEAVAEGEPELLQGFVDNCRHGPPGSRVEQVEVQEKGATPADSFSGFAIR